MPPVHNLRVYLCLDNFLPVLNGRRAQAAEDQDNPQVIGQQCQRLSCLPCDKGAIAGIPNILGQKRRRCRIGLNDEDCWTVGISDKGATANLARHKALLIELPRTCRMVIGATPNSAASSRCEGNRVPGGQSP